MIAREECRCEACLGWHASHRATKKAWGWLSDQWRDMEPERRQRIAATLRNVDEIFFELGEGTCLTL